MHRTTPNDIEDCFFLLNPSKSNENELLLIFQLMHNDPENPETLKITAPIQKIWKDKDNVCVQTNKSLYHIKINSIAMEYLDSIIEYLNGTKNAECILGIQGITSNECLKGYTIGKP